MRRLLDAVMVLVVASNGYHVLVLACRWLAADRHGLAPDLAPLLREVG